MTHDDLDRDRRMTNPVRRQQYRETVTLMERLKRQSYHPSVSISTSSTEEQSWWSKTAIEWCQDDLDDLLLESDGLMIL